MRGARMMVVGLATGLALAAGGVAVAASPSTPTLRVTPSSGGTRTTFTVHFTAPAASGSNGGTSDGTIRSYSLTASPGKAGHGCIDSVSLTPRPTQANQAMAVKLNPSRLRGHWCVSTYSGQVTETIRPNCAPSSNGAPVACPQYIALDRIGSFRFKVTG